MVRAVESVLGEIGAGELPVELVLNKVDRVDELGRRRLRNRFPDALLVSALTGEGLPELRARIASLFSEWFEPVRLFVPHAEAARLSELYALGTPIDEREDGPDGVTIVARLPRREVPRFARFLVVGDRPAREAESGRQS
jgi:GTP-binding protein HflX